MVDATAITPITPGSTSVSQAVSSANEAFTRIQEQAIAVNALLTDVGDKTTLNTTNKSNLVAAINEILQRFDDGFLLVNITGDLADLDTTNKSNLVAAANEVNAAVGDIDSLDTTTKVSIVEAINEVVSSNSGVGSLLNLTTTDKSSVVSAINELAHGIGSFSNLSEYADIISAVNSILDNIGTVASLGTTVKTDLVSAINELATNQSSFLKKDGSVAYTGDANAGGHKITNLANGVSANDAVTVGQIDDLIKLGDVTSLLTTTKENAVVAINELYNNVGVLSTLTTTAKSSIVAAINELVANAGYQTMQVKLSTLQNVKLGSDVTTDHDESLDFRSSNLTPSTGYDLRILRKSGQDSDTQIINGGAGKINFATNTTVEGIVNRVRIGTSATAPLEIYVSGTWTPVAYGGASLPLAGGTMTGPIVFNKTLSGNNIIEDWMQGYGVYSENVATYSGSTSRLWITGPASGEMHLGPKSGSMKGLEVRADRMDVTGEIFGTTDITLLSDERVKEDIHTIQSALGTVNQMRGVHYTKDDKFSTGVIAQEMLKVAPELVKDAPGNLLAVNYPQMAGYFIEAIKDLTTMVLDLQEEVRKLRGE